MGDFFNTVCPGVYIEQNAPRAVRSKARGWTHQGRALVCSPSRVQNSADSSAPLSLRGAPRLAALAARTLTSHFGV